MSCKGLGLYSMPVLRLSRATVYKRLDLSNNQITGVESFDFSRFIQVDLRGNPLRSCQNIPTDIVLTDSCESTHTDESSKINQDDMIIVENRRDNVKNPITVHNKIPVKKNDEAEKGNDKPVTGVDVVDNRNGNLMVIVVGSSTVGGVGLAISVVVGLIVHLYKKGLLKPSLDWFLERVTCGQYRRPVRRIPSASAISCYEFDHDGNDSVEHDRPGVMRPSYPPPPPPMCTILNPPTTGGSLSEEELVYHGNVINQNAEGYMLPQCNQLCVTPNHQEEEVYMEIDEM